MSEVDPQIDQTSEDVVTGVEVVDGVLTFRRHDGTTLEFTAADFIPTEDPETAGALWSDDGTVMMSQPSDVFLASLPSEDPEVAGQLWNDDGAVMVSEGP